MGTLSIDFTTFLLFFNFCNLCNLFLTFVILGVMYGFFC
nr:MAG TPA: hypothetical protein [Inoviridae sp.]